MKSTAKPKKTKGLNQSSSFKLEVTALNLLVSVPFSISRNSIVKSKQTKPEIMKIFIDEVHAAKLNH